MASTYKLYFYKEKKGSAVTPTSSVSMTFGNSSHKVTLSRMKYKKKVYEPCEILAELSIDGIAKNSEVVATFLNQKVDMEVEYETADKTKKSVTIATNYFVYKVRPVFNVTSSTSMTVELGIYSADKMMTLDKYSRAYTAKKLYTDILVGESEKYHLKDNEDSTKWTTLNKLVANHMQMLKYKVTEKVGTSSAEVTGTDELRIPYVVQYNESFYQFMVRTANRYGEFLYFEDGKLNLGMQPSDANYYKIGTDGKNKVVDWATESNAVQKRYYESVLSEGITVEDRAYSYNDHKKTGTSKSYASSSDKRYNFDAVPADEWVLPELEDGKYLTQGDLWQEELRTHIVAFVCRCLGNSNLADFLVNLAKDIVLESVKIAEDTHDFNSIMTKDNYNKIKSNSDQLSSSSSSNYKQFVSYSGSTSLKHILKAISGEDSSETNYTNVFYPIIRNKEKEIGEQAVWLDFGDKYHPIKLGDKLRVEDTDYVVINVEGSYDVVEKYIGIEKEIVDGNEKYKPKKDSFVQEKLLISAVPMITMSSCKSEEITVTEFSGINPWTASLPIPPALPDVVIRDARPQVAFVTQYTDPDSLGRIRVRYPWQSSDGDASPWIRVTLPLATSGGCVNFTPSIGDEVMVGYEHGNIDHPYAMGYLAAPFVNNNWHDSLPYDHWGGQHGIKVKTGHHLTFTDGANAAAFTASMVGFLNFVKPLVPAGAWPDASTGAADMAGGFELSDRYGIYRITGSTDERSIKIESPMGTVDLNAFQGITISAPNGDVNITGKNVSINAKNSLNITSGETIKDRFYYQKLWKDSGLLGKAGALGWAVAKDGLVSLRSTILDEFIDVSFLRCVLEAFLRPVDGTLQIKSYTFIQMEAGPGATEIPHNSLVFPDKNLISSDALKTSDDNFQKLVNSVGLVEHNVNALIESVKTGYSKLITAKGSFMNISGAQGINKDQGAVKFKDIIGYACGNDGGKELNDQSSQFNFTAQGLNLGPTDKNLIIEQSNAVRVAAKGLADAVKGWTDLQLENVSLNGIPVVQVDREDIRKNIQAQGFYGSSINTRDELKGGNYDEKIGAIHESIWDAQKRAVSRYVAYLYIKDKANNYGYKVGESLNSADDALDNEKWRKFIKSIIVDDTSIAKKAWQAFKGYGFDKVVDEFKESPWKWKNGFEGKILFSDAKGRTALFDANENLKSSPNQNIKEANCSTLHNLLIKL